MKKTMRKSALLSSVAMLIVSAIVLTSATYAWFSSSKKVTVQELSTNVKVSTGLLISVDKGTTWGTSVNFAQALPVKEGWGAGIPQTFDPVSTADGNTWVSAIFEDGVLKDQGAPTSGINGKFVAVPLWVTGPVGELVNAKITFTADEQSAKCVKFALVKTANNDGVTATGYANAVAATANDDNKFVGVSTLGTVADTEERDDNAYVSSGGTTINEVAAENGINFTIDENTSTTNSMKFIAFIWLEGNDADCAMLKFKPAGESIKFEMSLELAA